MDTTTDGITDDEPEPICHTSHGPGGRWMLDNANTYPPGYPRICPDCFPEADVNEDGFAPDFDHREVVDYFVRTGGTKSTGQYRHRPKGIEPLPEGHDDA